MEIVVKRIAKKKTYTIGHLYILSDKDVKRTWRSGVKIGDKRIFEHSFDKAKLDKERSEERRVEKECRSRWSPYH